MNMSDWLNQWATRDCDCGGKTNNSFDGGGGEYLCSFIYVHMIQETQYQFSILILNTLSAVQLAMLSLLGFCLRPSAFAEQCLTLHAILFCFPLHWYLIVPYFLCLQLNQNSKAYRQGLQVGDYVDSIEGQSAVGLMHNEALQLIRDANHRLTIQLRRWGVEPLPQQHSVEWHIRHSRFE